MSFADMHMGMNVWEWLSLIKHGNGATDVSVQDVMDHADFTPLEGAAEIIEMAQQEAAELEAAGLCAAGLCAAELEVAKLEARFLPYLCDPTTPLPSAMASALQAALATSDEECMKLIAGFQGADDGQLFTNAKSLLPPAPSLESELPLVLASAENLPPLPPSLNCASPPHSRAENMGPCDFAGRALAEFKSLSATPQATGVRPRRCSVRIAARIAARSAGAECCSAARISARSAGAERRSAKRRSAKRRGERSLSNYSDSSGGSVWE